MRCERVTRPTLRGVKRAEDSVKEDICLELVTGGVEVMERLGVKLELELAGWGPTHRPPTFYTPRIPERDV